MGLPTPKLYRTLQNAFGVPFVFPSKPNKKGCSQKRTRPDPGSAVVRLFNFGSTKYEPDSKHLGGDQQVLGLTIGGTPLNDHISHMGKVTHGHLGAFHGIFCGFYKQFRFFMGPQKSYSLFTEGSLRQPRVFGRFLLVPARG